MDFYGKYKEFIKPSAFVLILNALLGIILYINSLTHNSLDDLGSGLILSLFLFVFSVILYFVVKRETKKYFVYPLVTLAMQVVITFAVCLIFLSIKRFSAALSEQLYIWIIILPACFINVIIDLKKFLTDRKYNKE